MAFGGFDDMDEEFELFQCPVCIESLIDKQPRLLHCGHTFCTPCLHNIKERDKIICPKCRRKTPIPSGIEGLARNTDLAKIKEREEELIKRKSGKCQMCKLDKKAKFICTTCHNKPICKNCAEFHKNVPALSSHKVLPIDGKTGTEQVCENHDEILNYYCPECSETVCIICISGPNHADHTEKLVDLEKATKDAKQNIESLKNDFDITHSKFASGLPVLNRERIITKQIKNTLQAKLDYLNQEMNKVTNTENVLKRLSTRFEEEMKMTAEIKEQLEDVNMCKEETDIHKLLENFNRAKNELETMKELLNQDFKSLQYSAGKVLCDDDLGKVKIIENKTVKEIQEQELSQNPPLLGLEIEVCDIIKNKNYFYVKDLIPVLDGTVLLHIREILKSHEDGAQYSDYVIRIDTSGKLLRKYTIAKVLQGNHMLCACIHKEKLLISTSNGCIVTMNLDGPPNVVLTQTKLPIKPVAHITAFNSNTLLVTQKQSVEHNQYTDNPGKVYEYNIDDKHSEVKLLHISNPGKVRICEDGQVTKFVISCDNYRYINRFATRYIVKIFDSNWQIVTTIEKDRSNFFSPVTTPSGSLLVVERMPSFGWFVSKFVKYNSQGNLQLVFGTSVVSSRHSYNNDLIAYTPPYLWAAKNYRNPEKPIQVQNTLRLYLIDSPIPEGFRKLSWLNRHFQHVRRDKFRTLFTLIMLILVLIFCMIEIATHGIKVIKLMFFSLIMFLLFLFYTFPEN